MTPPDIDGIERLSLEDLGAPVVEAWADLEARALEPNAYLSPHFVLPALRHLDPGLEPMFLAAYSAGRPERKLVGFGIFVAEPPTWRFPLRRLSAYHSKHSFLTGLLVDRDCAAPVVSRFLEFFSSKTAPWDCVEFQNSRRDGAVMSVLKEKASAAGAALDVGGAYQRAVLIPSAAGAAGIAGHLDRRRIRELQRQRRRLGEQGDLTSRMPSNVSRLWSTWGGKPTSPAPCWPIQAGARSSASSASASAGPGAFFSRN